MAETAVIILHYKNQHDTLECIESLFPEHNTSIYTVYVVYERHENGFFGRIKSLHPSVKGVELETNKGFAGNANHALRTAVKDGCLTYIIMNNDTVAGKEMVHNLWAFSGSDRTIGLMSPKIYFQKGFEYHKGRYSEEESGKVIWYAGGIIDWGNVYASHRGVDEVDCGQFDDICDTDFATGCCMLIKKQVIDAIGYLDEKYFLYYEDTDYSVRTRRAGFRVIYYPQARLWHKNASSSGKPGSDMHIYYQTRNRLYFGFKYAPIKSVFALLRESFRFLFKGKLYSRAVKDYYYLHMGKQQ